MARRPREAEEKAAPELARVQNEMSERAAQAAEQFRVQMDAERAAQTEESAQALSQGDDERRAMALDQLPDEDAERPASPAPENVPLPPDTDTPMAENSRPVTNGR
ncbi:hypothetical protein ACJ73_05170 [Blastomyces percursus]|uniref:Uncharacterized protein n=1 Tax=Blastomyces percursus TaxID=1658174 RepID=A0A1J9Q4J7_9EURO|nr:hypothetical protein ACJ73_05170 [Blastomyces percursus]